MTTGNGGWHAGKRANKDPGPRTQPYPGSKGGRSTTKNPDRKRISLAKVNLPPLEEDDDAVR